MAVQGFGYSLAAALLAAGCASATGSTDVATLPSRRSLTVAVDPRVELFVIAFKLAGSTEFNQNRLQPYQTEIEAHFGSFRAHPSIVLLKAVRDSQRLYFDRVSSLAVSVTTPPALRERIPFDQPTGRCCTPATIALLPAMRAFYSDARASEFFAAHQQLYDSAATRLRRLIEQEADLEWFAPFFGVPSEEDFIVVPLLANSGTNFGPAVRPIDQRPELYAIIGHEAHDSAGYPIYQPRQVATLVHEFNHPFVNPVVNSYRAQLEAPAARTYAMVADAMREQGYGNWLSMVYESLVDAAVGRYYHARAGVQAMRAFTEAEHARGWLWLTELATLLGEYEADRASYPTLRAFMPRIVAFFDSVPDRLPAMQRAYDELRPRIRTMSIENGSVDVDPGLRSIEIRFDRAMQPTADVRPVPGGRTRLPQIVSQQFDSTRTVFTMEVELEAQRHYEFTFNGYSGGRFVSTEGIPLARTHVQFRTR